MQKNWWFENETIEKKSKQIDNCVENWQKKTQLYSYHEHIYPHVNPPTHTNKYTHTRINNANQNQTESTYVCAQNENEIENTHKTVLNICVQNPNDVSHVSQKYNQMATGFGGDPVSSFFTKVRAKQF